MPRRRRFILSGIIACWLLAGINGGSVLAEAEGAGAGSGTEAYIEAAGVTVSDPAALTGRSGAQRLEQAAEALYGYVLEGDVVKARAEAEEISQIFISSSFEGLTSVEGVNALSAVIMDLKSAMAAVEASPQRWEAAAARLRLAANSLNHPRQPMWLQYYKLVREDLNDMEQSAAAGDLKSWKAALARLQSRYDNIRPAVIISRPPEAVNTFDSWLSFAQGSTTSAQPVERARLLEIVSYGQDAAAFIITALAYAAYRKYRGQNGEWKTV
jgi:sporulation protein YpjB